MDPGHAKNCLLLMDFIRVRFGGMNDAWRRHLIHVDFKVMAYALLE